MINSEKLISEFNRIKSLGFIKSNRSHNTGIGKTFEDYLGVTENNSKDCDFEVFEVKTQRALAQSYITLFTKSPSHPRGANRFLKDNFGKPDNEHPDVKVLHTSIFGDRYNTFNNEYGFKITVNDLEEKLFLQIKSLNTHEMVSESVVYWDFEDVKAKKLDNTIFVWAERHFIDGDEYFHFTKAQIYYGFSFAKLIDGFKKGYIMFDIRMGSYKTGKNKGKPHDHGSGFRVKRENLKDLFEHYIEIE